ncbi:copine-9-like [Contarinia nasturtii]|uniref:copine-9-like n=1 Tax=Contarinia nasturtii TaxID=265458 RepID=UPI0012D4B2BB|nr:copine-9-like [Contarinia nasturtii]
MAFGAMAIRNKAPRRVKQPPKLPHSMQYITDEMLMPFVPSFMPTSQVELTISAKGLLSTHLFRSKSDPVCIVYVKRPWQNKYKEVGRTETIENTHNPQWLKKIILDYNFETIQMIKFEIRDKDLIAKEYLGQYETKLSDLVASYGCQSVGKLNGKVEGVIHREYGDIIIVTEEVISCKQIAEIKFCGEKLPKPSWLRRNHPFLMISRSNEDSTYSLVGRTEPCRATQNPCWNPFTIRATTLCNGDFDRSIRMDCYNFRDNGKHKLIGTCYASVHNLKTICERGESRALVNEEKQKAKPKYVPSGVLKVAKVEITEDITFLDFIRNGTEMHFAVAIDFTASNGVHTDPKSLHYLSGDRMNSYEIALRGIGQIIEQYSNTPMFPAFGFGAKIPPDNRVSFQFPLNNNTTHPYCDGIDEIVKHYREQLNMVQLYGPTNFSPVINDTISIAQKFQDGKHYFVLLIVTDGVISDMLLTKRAIIEASKLPISIIIVGVGDDNFEAMEELDSDDVRLSVDGHFAERDIVQFVPLNSFLSKDGEHIVSQFKLAEEVLAEIPEQLTSYMKSRGFKPQIIPTNMPSDPSVIVPTAPIVPNSNV